MVDRNDCRDADQEIFLEEETAKTEEIDQTVGRTVLQAVLGVPYAGAERPTFIEKRPLHDPLERGI